MALSLKVLTRAAAQHARLIGEATPKTPKTPCSGLSRFFSPMAEELEQSAGKRVLSGSPSKPSAMQRVPALPAAELARQSFLARRAGCAGRAYAVTLAADTLMAGGGGGDGAVPQLVRLLGRGQDGSKVPAPDMAPQRLPVLLGQRPGGVRCPPNYDDASEKEIAEQVSEAFLARQSRIMDRRAGGNASVLAGAQRELVASALPAAELARQSFLARSTDRAGRAYNATFAADTPVPQGGYGAGPQLVRLLGRGQDASNAPAPMAPQSLPVLLGQRHREVRRPPNYHDANQKDIAEQVREAFLARQSRVTDRDATSMVP